MGFKWTSIYFIDGHTPAAEEDYIQSEIEGLISIYAQEDFEFTIWGKVGLPSVSIAPEMRNLFHG